jgi:hypothetical protein
VEQDKQKAKDAKKAKGKDIELRLWKEGKGGSYLSLSIYNLLFIPRFTLSFIHSLYILHFTLIMGSYSHWTAGSLSH